MTSDDAQSASLAEISKLRPTSALVADALDIMGLRRQCLGPDINPLRSDEYMIGRAFTVRSEPATNEDPDRPYEGLLVALDELEEGDVFVYATNRSNSAGVWGELITTACQFRRAAGALTDGLVRDATRVRQLAFPVFSRGTVPYDTKGRIDVVEHGIPVTIDGIQVSPDDLIVADDDGVVVVPVAYILGLTELVAAKQVSETSFRNAVAGGVPPTEAFARFGVL